MALISIYARGTFRNTPAHVAAYKGDVDTIRVLIAAGIDFHTTMPFGETILHSAVHNCKGVLEYLLRQEGVRNAVMNDKGNWEGGVFRRSGFLVLSYICRRVCIFLNFGNLGLRTLSKNIGEITLLK